MEHDQKLLQKIADIESMDIYELRVCWIEYFNRDAPKYSKASMRRRLIHRVQEIKYGGISAEVKIRIDQIYEDYEKTREKVAVREAKADPLEGSVISREHNGVIHEVTVLEEGFLYNKKQWRSLSAIANAITGKHQNGQKFFGRRKKRVSSK